MHLCTCVLVLSSVVHKLIFYEIYLKNVCSFLSLKELMLAPSKNLLLREILLRFFVQDHVSCDPLIENEEIKPKTIEKFLKHYKGKVR